MTLVHAFLLTPASGGMKAPDLMVLGYDHGGLTAWLGAMDDGARERFIGIHTLTLDLIFPFLLTWALYRLLLHVLAHLPRFQRQRRWVKTLLPLLLVLPYLVFDIIENMTVLALLSTDQLPTVAGATQLQSWTVLKYAGVVLAFVSLAIFWLSARRTELNHD